MDKKNLVTGPAEYKVVVTDNTRDARDLLVESSGLSARRVADAMAAGAAWHRNAHGIRRIRRRSTSLAPGDELFLNYDEEVLGQSIADAALVQDGTRWSAWYKPFGMRSQGSRWGDHTTLGRFAENSLGRESFIVHRLDMAATGLMLLAHDKKAAAHLSGQFAARTVIKRYHVIVHGKFPAAKSPQQFTGDLDGKPADTRATRLAFDADNKRSLVVAEIGTGRKHQVRRHLANAGFPVVGDRRYGIENDTDDLRLCASYLEFDDPVSGARIKIERPPADWL